MGGVDRQLKIVRMIPGETLSGNRNNLWQGRRIDPVVSAANSQGEYTM